MNGDQAWPGTNRVSMLLGVIALLAGLGLVSPSASAVAGQSDEAGSVELVSLTPSVTAGGEFRAVLAVDEPPAGALLQIVIGERIGTRQEFVDIDAGSVEPATLHSIERPLDPLLRDGRAFVTVPLADEGTATGRFDMPIPGVYPITFTLVAAGRTEGRLSSYFVYQPDEVESAEALLVGLVFPIHGPPSRQPDGAITLDPELLASIEELLDIVNASAQTRLSLAVRPELLHGMVAAPGTEADAALGALRFAARRHAVIADTYVDLDATAWFGAGMTSEVVEQLTAGRQILLGELGPRTDGSIWLAADTITPETISQLRGLGITELVLSPDAVSTDLDQDLFPFTLARSFEVLDGNDIPQPAVLADQRLADQLADRDAGVSDGYRFLAELAVIAFEQPTLRRGVVATAPSDAGVSPDLLSVVLDGLGKNPLLDAVRLDRLFDRIAPVGRAGQLRGTAEPLQLGLAPAEPPELGTYPADLADATASVSALTGLLPAETEVEDELRSLLLISGSQDLPPGGADQYLDAIRTRVAADTAGIAVQAPGKVTLAARSGSVPVVVTSDLDYEVSVVVEVASDKLEFPNGSSFEVIVGGGANELSVPVTARSSGDSNLTIRLLSPDRTLEMAARRSTVTSTALSGVGLVIAVAALGFLLAWWLRHIVLARRHTAGDGEG